MLEWWLALSLAQVKALKCRWLKMTIIDYPEKQQNSAKQYFSIRSESTTSATSSWPSCFCPCWRRRPARLGLVEQGLSLCPLLHILGWGVVWYYIVGFYVGIIKNSRERQVCNKTMGQEFSKCPLQCERILVLVAGIWLKVSETTGFWWRCPNVQAQMQWDDLNWERTTYSAFGAYSQSKLANVLFSAELARRLEGTGVRPLLFVSWLLALY